QESVVSDLTSRWCGRTAELGGLFILIAATVSTRAVAQVAFNPSAQLWPTSADAARPSVSVFGSAVACARVTCDPAPSVGLGAALVGPLRVAVAGPRSSPQFGFSYAWGHIDIATRIGQGATVALPLRGEPRNMIMHASVRANPLNPGSFETTYTVDATRWS